MSAADALESAQRAITVRAWQTNRARAAELAGLAADWRRSGVLTAEGRARARAVAHSIRGSAGTFGYPDASLAAEELEATLDAVAADGSPNLVEALVDRIHAALAREPGRED